MKMTMVHFQVKNDDGAFSGLFSKTVNFQFTYTIINKTPADIVVYKNGRVWIAGQNELLIVIFVENGHFE